MALNVRPAHPGAQPNRASEEPPARTVTEQRTGKQHNFLVRALWYIFVGWWLTGIALTIGYLAGLTIAGLPLAFWIFNRTGTLLTLRRRTEVERLETTSGQIGVTTGTRRQRSLLLRAVYFVFVGWWLALIWMLVAYIASMTIVLIPIGIMMRNRLPALFTLQRN